MDVKDLNKEDCNHHVLTPKILSYKTLDVCLIPDVTDLTFLKEILRITLPQKPLWLMQSLKRIHPKELSFDLVEVDFWNGVLLQQGSISLHFSWAPWIPLFLEHMIMAGSRRPKRWHWLPNSYCIADPDHVNLSLEVINLWKQHIFNPGSLAHCCRTTIRNSMKTFSHSEFETLPLAPTLIGYVRLDDIQMNTNPC